MTVSWVVAADSFVDGAATRFALTIIAEIDGGKASMTSAGWVGVTVAVISAYAEQ